jgi:hypothetical protein
VRGGAGSSAATLASAAKLAVGGDPDNKVEMVEPAVEPVVAVGVGVSALRLCSAVGW